MNGASDLLTFRRAFPDEVSRAKWLCPPSPLKPGEGGLQVFVAVKQIPIERIVGSALWRRLPTVDREPCLAAFEWTMVDALVGQAEEEAFLRALSREVRATLREGSCYLRTFDWINPDESQARILIQAGFQPQAFRTLYEGDLHAWFQHLEKQPDPLDVPRGHRLASPGPLHFENLKTLLCGDKSCLTPSELAHGMRTAGGKTPSLFDPRCSALLYKGEILIAACLANIQRTHLHLAALAADAHAHMRHLIRHVIRQSGAYGALDVVRFYIDSETRHTPFHELASAYPANPSGVSARYAVHLA